MDGTDWAAQPQRMLAVVARETVRRIADHATRHDYAFHHDGEPCMRAMTSRNCPLSHRYGRTFEESH